MITNNVNIIEHIIELQPQNKPYPFRHYIIGSLVTSRSGKLEIQVDVRHVVKRSLIKVEPNNLMCERIFVANSASVETRRNLQNCKKRGELECYRQTSRQNFDLPR